MSSDVFQGTGQSSPVLYHEVAERNTFVTSKYLADGHRDNDLSAAVTIDGEPITEKGETLLVGMVPIERRWAIGPAVDGKAELMDTATFYAEYEVWYTHTYLVKGQEPDDVSKAFHPTARNYVSWKVDPYDTAKLLPLGMPSANDMDPFDPERDGAKNYDPTKDRFVEAVEDPRDQRIADLEAKIAAMNAPVLEPVTESVEEQPEPMSTALCGEIRPTNKIKHHQSICKKCKEIEGG